jgi:hypothetical protein
MKTEDLFERFTQSAQEAVMKLRVRSALNPCLWLCGIVTLPSLAGAVYTTGAIQIILALIAGAPVLIFGVGFLFFMTKDPDKLQSEEYQIQKMALELIEEKGGRIPISPTSIVAITNPNVKALTAGEEGE